MQREYYISPKPKLQIENRGGKNLGRCYNASYFRVTALHPLSMEDFNRLRECGFLGYGQEFMCRYRTNDGKLVAVPEKLDYMSVKDVVPTGYDKVGLTPMNEETWEKCGEVIMTRTSDIAYYVYEVESRVDSSD